MAQGVLSIAVYRGNTSIDRDGQLKPASSSDDTSIFMIPDAISSCFTDSIHLSSNLGIRGRSAK